MASMICPKCGFDQPQAADEAEDRYYASMSAQDRLDLALEIVPEPTSLSVKLQNELREFVELLNSRGVEYPPGPFFPAPQP